MMLVVRFVSSKYGIYPVLLLVSGSYLGEITILEHLEMKCYPEL